MPLLNPDVPLRPMARLLIGVGLTAKVPEVAGLATDALIAAIDDSRIDAARLGESLRTVCAGRLRDPIYQPRPGQGRSSGVAKANRWAKSSETCPASALHAHVVACAIEQVLAGGARAATLANVVPLLELLREASVTCGRVLSAEARASNRKDRQRRQDRHVVKSLLALNSDVPMTVLAVQALATDYAAELDDVGAHRLLAPSLM